MSQTSPAASPSYNFLSAFNVALEVYEKTTKNKLLSHPLATQLQSCDSPAAVLSVLQDLVRESDQSRSSEQRLTRWLVPTVNVLFSFSATLGEGVGLAFSPAKVIFSGIGVLLLAIKDVNASQEMLADLFARVMNFFERLESYKEVPPTPAMTDMITKIMVEVLSILSIATIEIKRKRSKKYLRRLLNKSDIEDALRRLDMLTQEEARMAIAEVLKVTHMMDDKMRFLIDAIMLRNIDKTDKEKLTQLRQDLRHWLSAPDPSINHNIARAVHHEGTATWFFQGDIFLEWKSNPSLLWIYGKPGSGKSVLCSSIIEDIMDLHDAGSALVAYFYCDFRDKNKRSRRTLLLSILSQLSSQSTFCSGTLSQLFSTHDGGSRKPSDRALMHCLKEMLSLPGQSPIYLIIDALDECPDNSGMPTAREEVLELVKDLADVHNSNLHVCVTSRPEIDIQTTLGPLTTSLRMSLHDQIGQKEDIDRYVRSVVYSDSKMRRWRKEDKILVIETLAEKADGMFRWAYCQLEALRHCLPPSVHTVLDDLPVTLDETYGRILRDINKANKDHARHLLQCLTVAIRPLRVEELAEVLAVDFDAANQNGIPRLNPDWRWADQQQAVLSTCSSLVSISDYGSSQLIQFSHFTVKEYLTSDRLAHSNGDISHYHILLEPSHTVLAQACLGVLLRLDDGVNWDNARDIPLVAYAARHWVEHSRFENVGSDVQAAMESLFDVDRLHFSAWLRMNDMDEFWARFTPERSLPRAQPLYYAAMYGLYGLVKHLTVKNPQHVNAQGGQKMTPLVAALYGHHFQVAEFLCQHGADIHIRGHWERTLLHAASLEGLVDVVQWLLHHGADVDAWQDGRWTALHLVAFRGGLEVVRVLLENNADPNSPSESGEIPLHLSASTSKHLNQIDIMRLLLDHGADPNARDDEGSTPLHHSSYRKGDNPTLSIPGTIEGIRLLLEHGANIDAKDNKGETPLQVALANGHHLVAECLLGHGAALR